MLFGEGCTLLSLIICNWIILSDRILGGESYELIENVGDGGY